MSQSQNFPERMSPARRSRRSLTQCRVARICLAEPKNPRKKGATQQSITGGERVSVFAAYEFPLSVFWKTYFCRHSALDNQQATPFCYSAGQQGARGFHTSPQPAITPTTSDLNAQCPNTSSGSLRSTKFPKSSFPNHTGDNV
ncbi:hypothetical protein CLAIMM_06228 isoform 3 [Cladophialophora immunda]|nr:hypothetical protein CLAIMM_06228 isoform 3 [Cladophialophora immunda]